MKSPSIITICLILLFTPWCLGDDKRKDSLTLENEDMTFRLISPAKYGKDDPDFYLLETEVTNDMYMRYLIETGKKKGDEKVAEIVDAIEERERGKQKKDGTLTFTITRSTGDPVRCMKNRALLWKENRPPKGKENYPVALINIYEAKSFCKWLTKKHPEHGTFRLPSQEEWLLAAYGKDRNYPWGDEWDNDFVCCTIKPPKPKEADKEKTHEWEFFTKTSPDPVKQRPKGRTPEGIYGMLGNVEEFITGRELVWMGGSFRDSKGATDTVANFEPRQDYWGYAHNRRGVSEAWGFRVLLDIADRDQSFKLPTKSDQEKISSPTENPIYKTLHEAARAGDIKRVKVLISTGADVNLISGKYECTPLKLAIGVSNLEIVEAFIDAGADVNMKNKLGWTPLHSAVGIGNEEVIKALINVGADVNAKASKIGITPLSEAVEWGHEAIVEILIAAKADINVKYFGDSTLIDLALRNGHLDIYKILKAAGVK